MGRFEHLEMGDWQSPRPELDADDAGQVDERHFVEKAVRAFEDELYERALTYYSRALQYNANFEEAWIGQLRCLIEMQELQEAIIWSDRAMERFPKSGQVLAARAMAESRLGRMIAALGYSDAAFTESREVTAYMWIARGETLIPTNQVNAKACFMKAVELAPRDWSVRAAIGRSYLVRRCHHQALEHFKAAVQMDTNRFACWYWMGKCCEALGEIEDARRSYGRSIAIQPSYSRARDALRQVEKRGISRKVSDAFRRIFGAFSHQ